MVRLLSLVVSVALVVMFVAASFASCATATTTLNFTDGLNQHNPKAEAQATAIAQQARDDAARRELERQSLFAQVETEVKAQPAKLVGKSTWYFLGWTGVGVGALVLCIGLAFAVVAWAGKRATTIYPNKQGQYPIIERRGFGWMVLHDPSRQVGPGAVYRVPTLADVIAERLRLPGVTADYPIPPVSEPSLLAAASQSNAVAMTAAAHRWPKLPEFLAKSIRLDNTHLPSEPLPLPEGQAPVLNWPSRVPLTGLLAGQAPSLSNLVLGVTVHDDGKAEPVRADMSSMVHVLAAGASGWGKSQFLKMLVYQLASSSEPCNLVLADLERLTFSDFAKSSRLMFPVVDSERDLTAVLQELNAELERRKAAFGAFDDVDTLQAYNGRSDAPLAPVVLAIDEASEFLHDGDVADGIKTLARRGRKYGMWLVLGGQTFSSKDVATSTSLQFSTRCQFRAPVVTSTQTLVGDKEARALECPGRAILVLPGQAPVKVQAPFVTHADIMAALSGNGPARGMPVVVEPQAEAIAGRIRALAALGKSKREIQFDVFGYQGGKAFDTVSRVLADTSDTTTTE